MTSGGASDRITATPVAARRRPRIGVGVAALALAMLTTPALGQQQEFTLGEEGTWAKAREVDPASDEGVMMRARQFLAENRPAQAFKIADSWLERNERTDNPWLAEAYLIRGDAKTARGDEYQALYDYEEIIKSFPGTEQFALAVEREMDIGVRYLGGLKRKFLGLRIDGATGLGEELLMRVQERMPGSRLAERAAIELADYYYRTRDLKMAAEAYDVFLKNFPSSQYREKAMQRRVYSNIGRFKGPRYDASGLKEAELLIEDFAQSYPTDARAAGLDDALVARLDESAGAQMLDTARWYLRRDDPVSARLTVRRLLRKHPETVAAARALDLIEEQGWDAASLRPSTPATDPDAVSDTAPADAPAADGATDNGTAPAATEPASDRDPSAGGQPGGAGR